MGYHLHTELTGAPNEKNRRNVSNAVFCFLISFYVLLKGYLCGLIIFELFGCELKIEMIETCRERNSISRI